MKRERSNAGGGAREEEQSKFQDLFAPRTAEMHPISLLRTPSPPFSLAVDSLFHSSFLISVAVHGRNHNRQLAACRLNQIYGKLDIGRLSEPLPKI